MSKTQTAKRLETAYSLLVAEKEGRQLVYSKPLENERRRLYSQPSVRWCVAILLTVGFAVRATQAPGATITETEQLRDKIVLESGLQIFKPNVVRGTWELYLLGKEVWWALKASQIVRAPEPNHTAPILLASRPVPTFTTQNVFEAFGGVGAPSGAIVADFNALAAIEEPLTANVIAFNRGIQSYLQATTANDLASQQARLNEINAFGNNIKMLSMQSLPIIDQIMAQHPLDGLGDPVLSLAEAQAFITDVQNFGLPADEQQGLADLGMRPAQISSLNVYTGLASPATSAGQSLTSAMSFGRGVNMKMTMEVDKDIAALPALVPEPWTPALLLAAVGSLIMTRRGRNLRGRSSAIGS